jgi:site-specific recombinase XerD
MTQTESEHELVATQVTNQARPAAAYLASLSTHVSRASMASELNKVARAVGASSWQTMDWSTLNAPNVRAIMSKIEGAPATRNKCLAAIRGVAHMAEELHMIDADTVRAIERIRRDSGTREPAGREVESWELVSIMRVCSQDTSPAGARDAALIAIAAKTGARRAELAALNVENMTTSPDGAEFKVIGKRNKERVLYIDNGALAALDDWLAIRGREAGPVFVAINKAGHIEQGHRLTTTAMHFILQRRVAEAKITRPLNWHDFRRTVAGELLSAGEDISTVAGILGHANVTTTARYDRRPAEARRKAVRKISVPYFRRSNNA